MGLRPTKRDESFSYLSFRSRMRSALQGFERWERKGDLLLLFFTPEKQILRRSSRRPAQNDKGRPGADLSRRTLPQVIMGCRDRVR
jgi:hypothetical protein